MHVAGGVQKVVDLQRAGRPVAFGVGGAGGNEGAPGLDGLIFAIGLAQLLGGVVGRYPIDLRHVEITILQEGAVGKLVVDGGVAIGGEGDGGVGQAAAQFLHVFFGDLIHAFDLELGFGVDDEAGQAELLDTLDGAAGFEDGAVAVDILPAPRLDVGGTKGGNQRRDHVHAAGYVVVVDAIRYFDNDVAETGGLGSGNNGSRVPVLGGFNLPDVKTFAS